MFFLAVEPGSWLGKAQLRLQVFNLIYETAELLVNLCGSRFAQVGRELFFVTPLK